MSDLKTYADDLKVKDALELYFKKYHFANGGYEDKFFRIKIGPLFIPVPNTKARIKAVKIHDIHHLLTEYSALWKGEIEIGAWEIASGCGTHLVAWLLNFGSFSLGIFMYPKALFTAFIKGRSVKANLYGNTVYDDTLLNTSVGDLRKKLAIDNAPNYSIANLLHFLGWLILSLSVYALILYLSLLICP